MVDALKKLDKKFLIIAGCMVFLPILFIIILAIVQGCSNKKLTYEKYESKMISAAEKYIKKEDKKLTNEGESYIIDLSTLVDSDYIKATEDALDDTCTGKVIVRRNGSSIKSNDGGFLNYIPSLKCDGYNSNSLINLITKNIVTSESGLYKNGDEYIFKGPKVDNYISFFGKDYRILGVDRNGFAKLIASQSDSVDVSWDMKYSIETKRDTGINIYKDSNIHDKLLEYYGNKKKISQDAKKHIVANDICIGKRYINDTSLTSESDCSQILKNEIITLINITDFAKASLDNNCTSIVANSCRNYNYLKALGLWTWTVNGVTDNSYEAYYLGNGIIRHQEASSNESYNVVIHIDSNEIVLSGDGSKKNPYVIK